MSNYIVEQGDCISSIAYRHGLFWETIWNHPKNATLRRNRNNPNVLSPGDELYIPEKTPGSEERSTGARHRFVRKGVPGQLCIRLLLNGKPRSTLPYILNVDGTLVRGTTDENGYLRESIPPNAVQGKVTLMQGEESETYELRLGSLDPLSDITGVQGRLANLGFHCDLSGTMDDTTALALAEYQRAHGLKITGELDQSTRAKLAETHDVTIGEPGQHEVSDEDVTASDQNRWASIDRALADIDQKQHGDALPDESDAEDAATAADISELDV